MSKISVDYPKVLSLFGNNLSGRQESHAFLSWFLENFYRLDEFSAQDCVCDGPDDMGVDGIYVDEDMGCIDVFQCKLFRRKDKTLGDRALREFKGSLLQFADGRAVENLAMSTNNRDLARIINDNDIVAKINNGYLVRGIYVANIKCNNSARNYLRANRDITVYDKELMVKHYVSADRVGFVNHVMHFDITGYPAVSYVVSKDIEVVIASVKALDLINLRGIDSQELFIWNVRQSLGNTKVNKDIARSIRDSREHQYFMLFHNGITVLCKEIDLDDDVVNMKGYAVVNGCQSITTLYENRKEITDELRLFVRFIKINPESELATKITHHSNNQNGIKQRDLRSNSPIQIRLQNEFKELYGGNIYYITTRGEKTQAREIIDNELVARVILAFDLKEPWSCHQSYKLFDELYNKIFARPIVDAHRIIMMHDIYTSVAQVMKELKSEQFASYNLSKYFVIYLLRDVLECDKEGRNLLDNPGQYVDTKKKRGDLRRAIETMLRELFKDIDAVVEQRELNEGSFDFKRDLKSPNQVRALQGQIVPNYKRAIERDRADSFGGLWKKSEG